MAIAASKFPWASTLSLAYPIAATVYVATQTPAKPLTIVGYGLANMGYLLFAAGIHKGTFRVFGLQKRWQVFVAGVVTLTIGTFLCNVGFWD